MPEREVVLDTPADSSAPESEAVRSATERAEKAEAELAKLKAATQNNGHAGKSSAPPARTPAIPETRARAAKPNYAKTP